MKSQKVQTLALLALSLVVSPLQSIFGNVISDEQTSLQESEVEQVSIETLEQKMQLRSVVACEIGGTIL